MSDPASSSILFYILSRDMPCRSQPNTVGHHSAGRYSVSRHSAGRYSVSLQAISKIQPSGASTRPIWIPVRVS